MRDMVHDNNEEREEEAFKQDILEILGRERVTWCYQCGRCTSTCPSARFSSEYNPRRIMLKAIIGMRDETIKNPVLWQCAGCNSCEEICDHGVHILGALSRMKNIAAKEGNMPKAYRQGAELLAKCGFLANLSASERLRKQVGLEPLKEPSDRTVEEIRKILKKTALLDLVEGGGK
jgi:heterodisulfide reductase subunit C